MASTVNFTLSYKGERSDKGEIDFYDVSEALVGFQRYLALTTHLILNNEIITHAPSLKMARIYALPPEEGSWKITAAIMMTGTAIYNIGTADKDTPIGNIARSVYDYVIAETVGVHPDYEKTIGDQIKEERKKNPDFPDLPQSKLDSLIEKCQSGIHKMHRPIAKSGTASEAIIRYDDGSGNIRTTGSLDAKTYDYMNFNKNDDRETVVIGRVTSYSALTFKGRIYLTEEKRPIPFVVAEFARQKDNIKLLTSSLSSSALDLKATTGNLRCFVYKTKSRNDRLKYMVLTKVFLAD